MEMSIHERTGAEHS